LALSSDRRISLAVTIALFAIALAVAPSASPAATYDIPVDFQWAPVSPTPGQVVTFTATVGGTDIKNYEWDLNGDGSVDTNGVTATWSYPAPGSVNVRLRVKGKGNHRGEVVHPVSTQAVGGGGVVPIPPVASFTTAPAVPFVNQPVLFTSASSDPDGALTEQVWDLNGDGSYDNGGGVTALRTFADPGTYVIGLRVTDDAGLVSFSSQTVTVLAAAGGSVTTQKSGPRVLSPFPVVRIAGRITKRGTRVRLLRVSAPAGTRVSVRCTGRSCPFSKRVRTISTSAKSLTASVRVRRLERLLLPGVRVRVYVTKGGAFGKYTRFRFRAGKPPARTDKCLLPGSLAPAECPAS
jgi:hypothetical protein